MDKDWISEGGKEMSKYDKGDSQIDGQMSLEHLYEPEAKLFGVHRIFARARKENRDFYEILDYYLERYILDIVLSLQLLLIHFCFS